MQQTFYIDIEEDISSIIDRLRQSTASENYFVVPPRALLIQSIVNLKLIKREADKLRKFAVIVTQDELGKSLAEKAGLTVKSIAEENLNIIEAKKEDEIAIINKDVVIDMEKEKKQNSIQKKQRLLEIGSDAFYDENFSEEKRSAYDALSITKNKEREVLSENEKPLKNYLQPAVASKNLEGKFFSDGIRKKVFTEKPPFINNENSQKFSSEYEKKIDPQKEKSIERLFSSSENKSDIKKSSPQIKTGSNTKKIIYSFIILCIVSFTLVASYIFIPSAKLNIFLKTISKKTELNISGSVEQSDPSMGKNIALHLIQREESLTLPFEATGKDASVGTKARGMITIYNEFGDVPQQLIATTRFSDPEGRIFRISNNITVPGMTTIDSQKKPGVIEVEVVADQTGEEYNVQPTIFKIVGFKDGPKYDKFYAKSTKVMTGGQNSQGAASAISQEDLDSAKEKTANSLKEKVINQIKDSLSQGEVLPEEMTKVSISSSATPGKVGEVTKNFDYTVKATIIAMYYSKEDIEKIVNDEILKDFDNNSYNQPKISITYSQINVDFDSKKAVFSIKANLDAVYKFDSESFKSSILGKNFDQVSQQAKKTNGIKNVEIAFYPSFVSWIPRFSNRVELSIIDK